MIHSHLRQRLRFNSSLKDIVLSCSTTFLWDSESMNLCVYQANKSLWTYSAKINTFNICLSISKIAIVDVAYNLTTRQLHRNVFL